ncbi:MAG: UDP-N-acetylmuramoyl-L-alanyl-D-glutamate--2,6-diaminopimelate ligase [Candidatus Muiribacteriota bacterium]
MKLKDFLKKINKLKDCRAGLNNIEIKNIMNDSRFKLKNSIFLAVKGENVNGTDFIDEAFKNGAQFFLSDTDFKSDLPGLYVPDLNRNKNYFAKIIYNFPSKKIDLTGVTGTNGKTSTVLLAAYILKNLGVKTGYSGTVNVNTGNKTYSTFNTFPEGVLFIRYLAEALHNKCEKFVSEVSSHALKLKRTEGINFKNAVFTNLSREHLDFHKSMEDYFNSKKLLFDIAEKNLIINYDDEAGLNLIDYFKNKKKVLTYGKNKKSDFKIVEINNYNKKNNLKIKYKNKIYNLSHSLQGDFNAYNMAAAFALVVAMGYLPEKIESINFNNLIIPGRLEKIKYKNIPVFIDYAHTPDALENMLKSLSELYKKIIIVFGCGGERDRGKRSDMGRISSKFCYHVFLTNDNPRKESPEIIFKNIIEGISKNNYTLIENREEAIFQGLKKASSDGATLVIAGKGHEKTQEIDGKKIYFSDKDTVLKYED